MADRRSKNLTALAVGSVKWYRASGGAERFQHGISWCAVSEAYASGGCWCGSRDSVVCGFPSLHPIASSVRSARRTASAASASGCAHGLSLSIACSMRPTR